MIIINYGGFTEDDASKLIDFATDEDIKNLFKDENSEG